eukprot:scaffold166893_cov63-Cyclotella_meneghiniana.AAC.2
MEGRAVDRIFVSSSSKENLSLGMAETTRDHFESLPSGSRGVDDANASAEDLHWNESRWTAVALLFAWLLMAVSVSIFVVEEENSR